MYSPRHVPNQIMAVPQIPYTISGKKMEIPIKKILSGQAIHVSKDAMKNPESLTFYEGISI
jgi:acetoacetyl-CoA synthetase